MIPLLPWRRRAVRNTVREKSLIIWWFDCEIKLNVKTQTHWVPKYLIGFPHKSEMFLKESNSFRYRNAFGMRQIPWHRIPTRSHGTSDSTLSITRIWSNRYPRRSSISDQHLFIAQCHEANILKSKDLLQIKKKTVYLPCLIAATITSKKSIDLKRKMIGFH